MRFAPLSIIAASAILVPAVLGQSDDTPDIAVTATFPNNAGSVVQNGQANRVVLSITKAPGADRVLSLQGVTGAFLDEKKKDGQKGRILRNMTTTNFKKTLPLRSASGKPLQIPYDFWPEFKPQDNMGVEFRLIVHDGQTGKNHNIQAFRGTVKVVEPPKNFLDPALLSVYVFLAAVAAAVLYLASQAIPALSGSSSTSTKDATVKTKAPVKKQAAAPAPASGFDESWIPEQHLKTRKSRASGAASSGDESPAPNGPAAAARRRHKK